jgi:hypothetical protein
MGGSGVLSHTFLESFLAPLESTAVQAIFKIEMGHRTSSVTDDPRKLRFLPTPLTRGGALQRRLSCELIQPRFRRLFKPAEAHIGLFLDTFINISHPWELSTKGNFKKDKLNNNNDNNNNNKLAMV